MNDPQAQPALPPLIPLDSSHIASAGHDRTSMSLYINFRDGSLYGYAGVPEGVYQGLVSAKSAGQYFHARIKGRFQSAQIKSAPPKQEPPT